MDFAAWFQPALAGGDATLVAKRQQGTTDLAKSATVRQVLDLTRLAFGLEKLESDLPSLMAAYTKADDNFVAESQKHATEVLAGCVLATAMQVHPTKIHSVAAALSIVCASTGGLRKAKHHQDLLPMAKAYLKATATSAQQEAVELPAAKSWKTKLEDQIKEVEKEATAPKIAVVLREIGSLGDVQLDPIRASISKVATGLRHQREQSDMLWWLTGEWSESLDLPYSEIDVAAATILAAKELAGMTTRPAGHRSSLALLHKMLLRAKPSTKPQFTVPDIVNACPAIWRESLKSSSKAAILRELCPVTLALEKSLDTDKASTWPPVYEKAASLKASHKFSAIDLTSQMYSEELLSKLVS